MTHCSLIADSFPEHSAASELYRCLDKTVGIYPQCWAQHKLHQWEEKLPQSTLGSIDLSLAGRAAAARLFGASDGSLNFPFFWGKRLRERLAHSDLIHLQHLQSDTVSFAALAGIDKPVICELHHLFPLSALCEDPGDCNEYENGCQKCPRARFPKLVARVFRKRLDWMSRLRKLIFVAPNEAVKQRAEKSPLTAGREIRVIGTPVDSHQLQAWPRVEMKRARGILPYVRVLGINCHPQMTPAERRSEDILLHELSRRLYSAGFTNIHLLLMGREAAPAELPFPVILLREELGKPRSKVYSAMDLRISLHNEADSAGVATLESMACNIPQIVMQGDPAATYVKESHCGTVVPTGDVEALSEAVLQLLRQPILRCHLGLHARQYVTQMHDDYYIGELYRQLYEELQEA